MCHKTYIIEQNTFVKSLETITLFIKIYQFMGQSVAKLRLAMFFYEKIQENGLNCLKVTKISHSLNSLLYQA